MSKSIINRVSIGNASFFFAMLSLILFGGCNSNDQYQRDIMRGLILYEQRRYDQARAIFEDLAKNDYAPAFTNIGMMYANGKGYEQSYKDAAIWYRLGAFGGDIVGYSNLGFLYVRGVGVEKNCTLGLDMLSEAATAGEPSAFSCLGKTYAEGLCGEIDAERAVKNYEESMRLGNVNKAGFELALLYYEGKVVQKNCKKSLEIINSDAFKNDGQALRLIGRIYQTGCSGIQDMDKAFESYLKAVKAGDELSLQIIQSLTN